MAKKKKTATSSARGYATTSVASKPRVELTTETPLATSTKPNGGAPTAKDSIPAKAAKSEGQQITDGSEEAKTTHEPSPEELEEQLERDELQLLIEKHAPKIRRDASRQVSRAQTECRVIRAQAQPLHVSTWLSSKMIQHILDLAVEDRQHEPQFGSEAHQKPLSEDEIALRLWTLQVTLSDLGVPLDQVELGLKACLEKQSEEEDGSYIWGFEEALEFLSLQGDQSALPNFDQRKAVPSISLLEPDGKSI